MYLKGSFDIREMMFREESIGLYFTRAKYDEEGNPAGEMDDAEWKEFAAGYLGQNRFRLTFFVNGLTKTYESPLFHPKNKVLRATMLAGLFDIGARAMIANEVQLST